MNIFIKQTFSSASFRFTLTQKGEIGQSTNPTIWNKRGNTQNKSATLFEPYINAIHPTLRIDLYQYAMR